MNVKRRRKISGIRCLDRFLLFLFFFFSRGITKRACSPCFSLNPNSNKISKEKEHRRCDSGGGEGVELRRGIPRCLRHSFSARRRRRKKLATAISGPYPGRSMCHRSVDNCKSIDRQTFNGVFGHGLAPDGPLFVSQTATNRLLPSSPWVSISTGRVD